VQTFLTKVLGRFPEEVTEKDAEQLLKARFLRKLQELPPPAKRSVTVNELIDDYLSFLSSRGVKNWPQTRTSR
jgi:hypothetical protein